MMHLKNNTKIKWLWHHIKSQLQTQIKMEFYGMMFTLDMTNSEQKRSHKQWNLTSKKECQEELV